MKNKMIISKQNLSICHLIKEPLKLSYRANMKKQEPSVDVIGNINV